MRLCRVLCQGLLVSVLVVFLAVACGGKSAPAPTPAAELPVDVLLSRAGEKLAVMSTAKFTMVDETESGAKFFGTTFKSLTAEVKTPASFRMQVDVVAPGLGFAQIEMLAVEDEAYMKFSKAAPWVALPLDQVPFNFRGLGMTLRDLLAVIEDGASTGQESVLGVQTVRVEGNVTSEDLSSLLTSVDAGHAVGLTLWIDEAEYTLRQIRITGRIYDEDAAETARLLSIHEIDVPVDIQLPDLSSGS